MELDKATIRIRERGSLELLDLGLCILRRHGLVLAPLFFLAAAPFILLNDWLLQWFWRDDVPAGPEMGEAQGWSAWYFVFWHTILVALEFPIASSLVTLYLGRATFRQPATIKEVCRDGLGLVFPLFFRVVLRRLLTLCFLQAWMHPFLVEILVLERPKARDFARRSTYFHSDHMGALTTQFFSQTFLTIALSFAFYRALLFLHQSVWDPTPYEDWVLIWGLRFEFPLAVWITLLWCAATRYACYLDLRIRREGWEVELLMRAEALKLQRRLEFS